MNQLEHLKQDELEILTIFDDAPLDELVTITALHNETNIRMPRISAILLKLEKYHYIVKVTPTKYHKEIPFIAT